jgi:hypothetical protein
MHLHYLSMKSYSVFTPGVLVMTGTHITGTVQQMLIMCFQEINVL